MTSATIIEQTKNWIRSVVIGCNFCPFAARVFNKDSIRFIVLETANTKTALAALLDELQYLDDNETVETSFIIFPNHFKNFAAYLQLADRADELIMDEDYEGVYQVASFHPDYCFADADNNDAANFTNRSIYPMLHILREESIEKALEHFPDPDAIPERNVAFARQKGLAYMQLLRDACL